MSNKNKQRGRPSKFPPEFRRDAVAMVLDENEPRPIAEVARSLGVHAGTFGNWVAQERFTITAAREMSRVRLVRCVIGGWHASRSTQIPRLWASTAQASQAAFAL